MKIAKKNVNKEEAHRHIAFCPHCGNRAPQKLVHVQNFQAEAYSTNGDLLLDTFDSVYHVFVCETCNQLLIYHQLSEGDISEGFSLVWPSAGILDECVPKAVADCYSEAYRIKNLAPNAFAVQIRRALEAICDNRGAKKGTLHQRLNELAMWGEIPSALVEMTDVLRELGNIGAHATKQSIKPLHVMAIDGFFTAVIEYVYMAPNKLKKFRDSLEEFKAKDDDA